MLTAKDQTKLLKEIRQLDLKKSNKQLFEEMFPNHVSRRDFDDCINAVRNEIHQQSTPQNEPPQNSPASESATADDQ